jgi:hypothetical protein
MKRKILLSLYLILMLPVLLYAQNDAKESGLIETFDKRITVQILGGVSSLKVAPGYGIKNLDYNLPRILINTYGFRIGKRNFWETKGPQLWEIRLSTGKGKLDFNYTNTSNQRVDEFSKQINISNTMFGGSYGFWVPLYSRLDASTSPVGLKSILFDFKVGVDVMLLNSDNNEFGPFSYEYHLDDGTIETGSTGGQIMEIDSWVLFSANASINFLITKSLMLKFDFQYGIYPVSGPANSSGEATGLPNVWGNNRLFMGGIEILL